MPQRSAFRTILNLRRLSAILLVFLWACEPLELDTKVFFESKILQIEIVEVGKVEIRATVNPIPVDEELPLQLGFEIFTNPELSGEADFFPADLEDFSLLYEAPNINGSYYVRSVAQQGERRITSDVEAFDFELIKTNIIIDLPEKRVENDQIFLEGALVGLNSIGGEVDDYGFVYAKSESEILNGGGTEVGFGSAEQDRIFSDTLSDLPLNTDYVIYGFLKVDAERKLSKEALKVGTKDGWKKLPYPLPKAIAEGAVWVMDDLVYFGLGCRQSPCSAQDLITEIWNFNPSSGEINFETSIDPGLVRKNMAFFHYGSRIFFGPGSFDDSNLTNTIHFYNTETKTFGRIQDFLYAATGMISFVREDYLYIGGGANSVVPINFGNGINEFYRISLAEENANWEALSETSILFCQNNEALSGIGRIDGIPFLTNSDNLILGLGSAFPGDRWLGDFHRYNFPKDPSDKGTWEYLNCLDDPLTGAVSFQINNKAYFGIGQSGLIGQLPQFNNRFWELDTKNPNLDFIPKTAFPGIPRVESLGFSWEGKGYVMGGKTQVADNIDGTPEEIVLLDIWEYTPSIN